MKVFGIQLGILLLLLPAAGAQNSASDLVVLKDILVTGTDGHPQIELVLSGPVEATTSIAKNPDRLVIELPNTIDGSNLPKMQIKSNGIRSIEIFHSFTDTEHTKVVVEVDRALEYEISTTDNHVSFSFSPATRDSGGAVVAAKRGALTGIFHREKDSQPGLTESAKSTPAAATGGALSGRQASQPPTSGPAQKMNDISSSNSASGQSGSRGEAQASVAQAPSPANPSSPGASVQSEKTAQQQISVFGSTVQPRQGAASPEPASSSPPLTTPPATNVASGVGVAQAPSPANPVVPAESKARQTAQQPSRSPSALPQQSAQPVTAEAPGSAPQAASQLATSATQSAARDASTAIQSTSTTDANTAAAANTATAAASPENTAESTSPSEPRLAIRAADPSLRTVFRVKYVAQGVAYLDGGRSAGLKEGVKLEIRDGDLPAHDGTAVAPTDPRVIAELEVSAVAESSSVTDIHEPKRPVKAGDLAYLSSADADALIQANALSPTRKYPAVVSFTEGDPQDEEVRDQMPRPPLPSVNRARGRFGFDYMGTVSHGANSMSSSAMGMMFRGDVTRINGTYWNLSGYWRGRFTSQSPAGQQTLQDLINRTYHLSMTYDNPNSNWVAGFGRLYLPWANSLDTIDGGYVGRKISTTATLGIFGGSTPDPTSYDYAPNRSIGGAFVNFTGGDYTKLHYSSTIGAGLSMLQWKPDRPFGFLENTISYTQRFSVYDAMQVDSPAGNPVVAAPGPGLSRNFFTVRMQATPRLELDFNHTYFRDIPTFDSTLVGTGLLDKYLFQGFSAGARFEFMKNATVYTQLGRSSRTGDATNSLNQMYGINFSHLPWWGLRADFHYAQFNSSFGSGTYKAFSLSRSLMDNLQVEVLSGQQSFNGLMTNSGRTWFVINNVEANFGAHYFLQGSFTTNRGQMSYDQWMFTLGYRFDSRSHRK